MRRRASSRLVQLAVAGAVVAAVAGVGITSASAVGSASDCTSITARQGSAASTRAAIARLTTCLQRLEKASETAGQAAQRADERYLRAKAAARSAARDLDRIRSGAEAAATHARRSRARAGAVTMQLVRGSSAGQVGDLMLEGGRASRRLYGLSRLSLLTRQSHQLAQQAGQDSAAARSLKAQAAVKAQTLHRSSVAAQAAFATAKHESEVVAAQVASQRSHVRRLQAQLAALTPPRSAPAVRSAAAVTSAAESGAPTGGVDLPADASKAARAVAFARRQIGDPYVFAAAGPGSWDCSGLTMGAYDSVGISIGIHSATAQYNLARSQGHLVPYADRRPGDLIYYTDGGGDMYHTAIYSGNGMMIEAPYEGVDVREVPVRTHNLVGEVARPTA